MVYFFERHRGISGAGVPLPECIAEVADRFEGKQATVAEIIEELQSVLPDSLIQDSPEKRRTEEPFGPQPEWGMITLRYPAEGFPCNVWRVIKYKTVVVPC